MYVGGYVENTTASITKFPIKSFKAEKAEGRGYKAQKGEGPLVRSKSISQSTTEFSMRWQKQNTKRPRTEEPMGGAHFDYATFYWYYF